MYMRLTMAINFRSGNKTTLKPEKSPLLII